MNVTTQLKQQLADDFWRGRTWRGKRLGWDDMTPEEQAHSLRQIYKYDEDQPRDDDGKWTDDGGGGSSSADKPEGTPAAATPTASTPAPAPAAPSGPLGSIHEGGHVTEEYFKEGKAGKTVFENLNYDARQAINSNPENLSYGQRDSQMKVGLENALKTDPRWTKAFGTDGPTTYNKINSIISQWAGTSGDSDGFSIAMQLATRDEFELTGTSTKHMLTGFFAKESEVWKEAANSLGLKSPNEAKGALRAYARAEYNRTQEFFAAKGIKEVAVYRGMGRALGRQNYVVGATTLQPMSSFSLSLSTAQAFVPYSQPKYKQNVIASVVPVKSILSTHRTGRGVDSEDEVVVLGNKMGFIGFQKDARWPPPSGKIKWPKGKAWANVVKAEGDEDVDLNDLDIDADLDHADWTKTTWNLPPYKSPEFMEQFPDLAHFRTLPVYRHAVEAGLIVDDEWVKPTKRNSKGAVFLEFKEYDEDEHPRDEDGKWTDGGGGGGAKPGKDKPKPEGKPATSSKVRNALATYKPSTKEKQDRATAAEQRITKMIGGKGTDDNSPMDVTVTVGRKTIGVEVKSIQDNGNNKITMHPESLKRKVDWAKAGRGRSVHTVVVDTRHNKIYYREGAGSFRLHTLTPVKDAKHLRSLLGL